MGGHVIHLESSLPMPPELGGVLLAIGAVVLLVIGYDAYRQTRGR